MYGFPVIGVRSMPDMPIYGMIGPVSNLDISRTIHAKIINLVCTPRFSYAGNNIRATPAPSELNFLRFGKITKTMYFTLRFVCKTKIAFLGP